MSYIELNNVSVEFPIYHASSRSLKKTIISASTGGLIGTNAQQKQVVSALTNISFSIKKGDRFGLIGHNGSGKTTLLRVLAGIYYPTLGNIAISGKVTPMFDISLGIDVECTGYENIMTRGLYLGFSRKEIENKIKEIVDFADLGDFLYMPVHTYSSGMNVRLAFAISTACNPEILLLDEWIGAGDATFIEKANKRVKKMVDNTNIMVVASHSMDLIRQWCNKAIWLEHGKMMAYGDVEEVIDQYLKKVA